MTNSTRRRFLGLLAKVPGVALLSSWLARPAEASLVIPKIGDPFPLKLDRWMRVGDEATDRVIRWIPVSERLPELTPMRTVLTVWGEGSAAFIVQIPVPKEGIGFHRGVTHWAELPAPPTEEKPCTPS